MKKTVNDAGLTEKFIIRSAATSREEIGNDIHFGTKQKLREHGIPFKKRAAVQITPADYEKYDYLVGMDANNIRNMLRIFGGDTENKIFRLLEFAGIECDVADPWYTGDFSAAYRDITEGCAALFGAVTGG